MTRSVRLVAHALATVLTSVIRLGLVPWLAISLAIPVAIATSIDTLGIVQSEFLKNVAGMYGGAGVSMELSYAGGAYLCFANALINGVEYRDVATLLLNVSRPCIGMDLARALGTRSIVIELGRGWVRILSICRDRVYAPFVVLPLGYGKPRGDCVAVVIRRGTPGNIVALMLHSILGDVSRVLRYVKIFTMSLYIPVVLVSIGLVLKRLGSVVKCLRLLGFPENMLLTALALAMGTASVFMTVLGVALGTVVSHIALSMVSKLVNPIPYRPAPLNALYTYLPYSFATSCASTVLNYVVRRGG